MLSVHYQYCQIFYCTFIFLTQAICQAIQDDSLTTPCNEENLDCIMKITESTTAPAYTTSRRNPHVHHYSFNWRFVIAAGVGIVTGLIVLRVCFMFCASNRNTATNSIPLNRRTSVVRPQVATITSPAHFKPDLPPSYTEAVTIIDNDSGKPPSYETLNNEQTQQTVISLSP